jgi:hypothetical protein
MTSACVLARAQAAYEKYNGVDDPHGKIKINGDVLAPLIPNKHMLGGDNWWWSRGFFAALLAYNNLSDEQIEATMLLLLS